MGIFNCLGIMFLPQQMCVTTCTITYSESVWWLGCGGVGGAFPIQLFLPQSFPHSTYRCPSSLACPLLPCLYTCSSGVQSAETVVCPLNHAHTHAGLQILDIHLINANSRKIGITISI